METKYQATNTHTHTQMHTHHLHPPTQIHTHHPPTHKKCNEWKEESKEKGKTAMRKREGKRKDLREWNIFKKREEKAKKRMTIKER